MQDLASIGIERIAGVFSSGSLDELLRRGPEAASVPEASVASVESDGARNILDVRSRAEFAEGHIPHAINVPLGELPRRLAEVPSGETVVHCQGGTRSAIAASILQQSGRNDVSNLPGGFPEYVRSGRMVERGNGAD